MKKSTKAILASTFVFPGMGQLLYKRYISSAAFAGMALIATSVIIIHIVEIATDVLGKIRSGEVPPNVLVMRQLITEQYADTQTQSVEIAIWVLIAAWILSILDAYRIAKSQGPRV